MATIDASPSPEFTSEISFADSSFVDVGLNIFQATILQLVHIRGDTVKPLGTCFAITNDGLCVTAKHVIEDFASPNSDGPRFVELTEHDGTFGALYISSDPHPDNPNEIVGGILPAYRIYTISGIDIALVKLTLPVDTRTEEPIRFPAHQLRLSIPGVGETIFGLGYRNMSWNNQDAEKSYQIDHKFSATKGEVEELHVGGRDLTMLPYPCFRTSARFDSGMSGGPITDQSGRVLGVICSSYGLGEGEAGHISYGSLIAPMMAMTIDMRDADGSDRRGFLWDLVQGGPISADKRGTEIVVSEERMTLKLSEGCTINAALDG